MIIKKSQRTPEKANEFSTIYDYPMPDDTTGIAFQELNGRLPQNGWYKNTVCHETMFVIAGHGTLHIDDKSEKFEEGDVLILKPGQKHFGEYNDVKLITITSPNWYESQCEIMGDK